MNNDQTYIFEYPLNECIRACLKLEPILADIISNLNQPDPKQNKIQIMQIIKIINILDRPDLKTKIITLISQQQANLFLLKNNHQVDQNNLNIWIQKLDNLTQKLQQQTSLVKALKEDQLLTTILKQANNPGGIADFSVPQLQCWLQLPEECRLDTLMQWQKHLTIIINTVNTLLPLIRNSKPFKSEYAEQGFFQTNLNKEQDIHLVRIKLSASNLYPEISVGKHRMIIHFRSINDYDKTKQIKFQWMTSSLSLTKNSNASY